MSCRFLPSRIAAALLLLSIALPLRAATNWQLSPDQSGDWWTAQNWDAGVPAYGSTANIANGGTATIASGLAGFSYLNLGGYTATGTVNMTGGSINVFATEVGASRPGYFIQSGGTHTVALGWALSIRNGGKYDLSGTGVLHAATSRVHTGDFTQSGGTHDLTYGDLMVGLDVGSIGTYTLSGAGRLISETEYVGIDGGVGTFTQKGGTNTVAYNLNIGNGSYTGVYGSGTYDLQGGSLTVDHVSVGYSAYTGMAGTGSFQQSGGTCTIGGLYLGEYPTYAPNLAFTGICNFSGGSSHVYYSYIGNRGIGNFTQSGGNITIEDLHLGQYSGSQGTYSLNGGTLTTMALSGGSGTAVFNFGGGTLQAGAAFSSSLPMTLTGNGGNAKLYTAGYDVTLSGQLSGPGGLNKLGSNTLTLSGPNSYTGNTNVSAGTLTLARAGSLVMAVENADNSLISVASAAKLDLYGMIKLDIGSVTVPSATWTLLSNSGTTVYEPSFELSTTDGASFSQTSDRWYCITDAGRWTFAEATGVLSLTPVVPEPSTLALLGISAIALFAYARRRKR
jgi:fibronectin-binding autotransporter adhesin